MSQEKSKGKLIALADKAEKQALEYERLAQACEGQRKAQAFIASAQTYRERAENYRRQAEDAKQ